MDAETDAEMETISGMGGKSGGKGVYPNLPITKINKGGIEVIRITMMEVGQDNRLSQGNCRGDASE